MLSIIRRFFSLQIIVLTALSAVGHTQIFPVFTSPAVMAGTGASPEYATSSATVPNGEFGTAVLTVFAEGASSYLAYAVSDDGQNYQFTGGTLAYLPSINCRASFGDSCGASIVNFNGAIYVAYSDPSQNLIIAQLSISSPGSVGYTASVLQTIPNAGVTTVPAMAVFNNQLIIIYGSSLTSTKNALYQVTCVTVGSTCSTPSESYLGATGAATGSTPGLAVLNNTLWLCSQQNNSSHNLFIYKSTDGLHWSFVREDTGLQLGGGAQMVTYKNNLVLANQQNNSNHALFIFSSPDGVNWSAQEYPGIQMGAAPGLTLVNGGLSLSLKANNAMILYGSFASH